jgi:hypothetical protein
MRRRCRRCRNRSFHPRRSRCFRLCRHRRLRPGSRRCRSRPCRRPFQHYPTFPIHRSPIRRLPIRHSPIRRSRHQRRCLKSPRPTARRFQRSSFHRFLFRRKRIPRPRIRPWGWCRRFHLPDPGRLRRPSRDRPHRSARTRVRTGALHTHSRARQRPTRVPVRRGGWSSPRRNGARAGRRSRAGLFCGVRCVGVRRLR